MQIMVINNVVVVSGTEAPLNVGQPVQYYNFFCAHRYNRTRTLHASHTHMQLPPMLSIVNEWDEAEGKTYKRVS